MARRLLHLQAPSASPHLTPRPLHIACFGTSITKGDFRVREQDAYPYVLRKLLRKRFPSASHRVTSHGYPGASFSAQYLHACLDRMLPRADIYVVELADNFMANQQQFEEAAKLVGEIVLALRERVSPSSLSKRDGGGCSGGGAVMLLAPFAQSCSRRLNRSLAAGSMSLGALVDRCMDNRTSLPAIMETFAKRNGVACLSARQHVAPLLRRAQNDSRHMQALLRSFLGADLVHPNPQGHRMLAQLIVDALGSAATLGSAAAQRTSSRRVPQLPPQPKALPAFAQGRVCALGEELHRHVIATSGWAYAVERSVYGYQPKPGYVANEPGATIDLCYRPPNTDERMARWFQLGFLRSWIGMGRARAECLRGCACDSRTFDGHDARARISEVVVSKLRGIRMLPMEGRGGMSASRGSGSSGGGDSGGGGGRGGMNESSSPCPCVVRLSVLNSTGSSAHKFKLVALFTGMRLYNPSFAICGSHRRCVEGKRGQAQPAKTGAGS